MIGNDNEIEERMLYGGAMNISVNKQYVDVSEVPHHQEVFQTVSCSTNYISNSVNARGSCFIVELLYLDTINMSDDESCSKHYFTDLSEANNAVSVNVTNKHDSSHANTC